MSFFDSVYKKLFAQEPQKDRTLVHEVIKRDSKYLYFYEQWRDSNECKDLLKEIASSYEHKLNDLTGELQVHILNSQYSNGFAITYNDGIGKENFLFLFDWLAEKIEGSLDYKVQISDRIITEKASHLEHKEKHYLKPSRDKSEKLIPQLFGNIHIEYILVDDNPSYIKLIANTYSDRQFAEPHKFEELINILFAE